MENQEHHIWKMVNEEYNILNKHIAQNYPATEDDLLRKKKKTISELDRDVQLIKDIACNFQDEIKAYRDKVLENMTPEQQKIELRRRFKDRLNNIKKVNNYKNTARA
jgi:hypothetical protein